MYINYKTKEGIEYAMIVTSVRKGSSVTKENPLYLGRSKKLEPSHRKL